MPAGHRVGFDPCRIGCAEEYLFVTCRIVAAADAYDGRNSSNHELRRAQDEGWRAEVN